MIVFRLLSLAALMLAGNAIASNVFLTNTTPETVYLTVNHYGTDILKQGDEWQQFVTEIPPYATRKVLRFNRVWGVKRKRNYFFDTYVTSNNQTVILKQKMRGTWVDSNVWHSASGNDFNAPWFDGWSINRFDTQYDDRDSLLGFKPHATAGYADFHYTIHNNTQTETLSGANELKVTTYNVEDLPLIAKKRGARMAAIPDHVKGYDVVMFQEAFSGLRNQLRLDLAAEYPYQTHIPSDNSLTVFDSGIFIVSRYPITDVADFIYPQCAGTDCGGQKGVLYAEIIKDGHAYHVTNTHAASFDTAEARTLRQTQFEQIRELVDNQSISAEEAVLMGGDMNVNKFLFPEDHSGMLSRLNATEPTNTGYEATFDARINRLIGSDKVQYLDYVVYSNTHRVPVQSRNDVRVPRSANDALWNWWDLSDHFPVMGEFRFQ